jgi:hypothetical protein
MDEIIGSGAQSNTVAAIRAELDQHQSSRRQRISKKFVVAALSAIPWLGGFIAAAVSIPADEADANANDLRTQWLEEHQRKLNELARNLDAIQDRFESFGPQVEDRIQSPEYLSLVRQAFRTWDQAETEEKRKHIITLLINCAGTRVCSDDVIRLFISWLTSFHDVHFAVIREIFQNPGSSRYDIWTGVYGDMLPREDSAEADLYKMLIRDLSTGGVIRQERDTTTAGEFVRKRPARSRGSAPTTMKSAFDDQEPYVLTELGKQFVHYTMNEAVTRLGST